MLDTTLLALGGGACAGKMGIVAQDTYRCTPTLAHRACTLAPAQSTPPPPHRLHDCPGMGAQKDMGLHQYAAAFAAGGLAAVVFDYRTFGGSQGQPRQWVSPSRHVQDWQAAVQHVTQELSKQVDTNRVCLWGTSFAGGHVLVTAASSPNVVAVVSQVGLGATWCDC